MKHVNLVVADGDRNTLGKYVSELRRMDGINVVGSTADGAELLALLSHVRADVVMTGLALKNVDGLGVLEAVHDMRGVHPKMLVLSNFCRDSLVERTMALGASYYMLKPADSHLLYKRICLLAEQTDSLAKGLIIEIHGEFLLYIFIPQLSNTVYISAFSLYNFLLI